MPLDGPHLWEALRYTERNPVRAQLVDEGQAWAWSSAAAHCGTVQADTLLSTELWQNHWTNARWREYLATGETESELASIRQGVTRDGREFLSVVVAISQEVVWILLKYRVPDLRSRILPLGTSLHYQDQECISVLVAVPDSGQILNKAVRWASAGYVIAGNQFGCMIRVEDQNLAIKGIDGIDQPPQLSAVGDPIVRLVFEVLKRIGLRTEFHHKVRAYLGKTPQRAARKAVQALLRNVRSVWAQRRSVGKPVLESKTRPRPLATLQFPNCRAIS